MLQQIGPYRILDQIGAGGMGEVYRATDTNLERRVAIKLLPEALAVDQERLARFEREAKTLAALNHPNIAHIYGLERDQGTTALVMELVSGPTLADRIAQGPIPIDEALPIAQQVAEALEAAHGHGIIHRDLKPANIKVRDDGMVKVLDFGLAKMVEANGAGSPDVTRSPTITTPAVSYAGVLLGTPAYMSPEQARGRTIDKRSDIWSFGCVLYEMLAGRRAFANEDSLSDTLAGILKGEPDWTALPDDAPPAIRALLERCLRKDVKRRLQDIGDARIQIEDTLNSPPPPAVIAARGESPRSWLWPAVTVLSLLTAAALAAWSVRSSASPVQPVTFDITDLQSPGYSVGQPLSPDGRTVVLVVDSEGKRRLWIRPLDTLKARVLPGTEDASRPFWSPDSQYVAFFAQGKLKKIAIAGGPPSVICNEPGRDGAWGPDNVILIGGGGKALLRVSAAGGQPTAATALAPNEATHDYPSFLPDGRRFLYMARRGSREEDWSVFAGSLDSTDRREIPNIHSSAKYSPSGHLLFERDRSLMAYAFDLKGFELKGEPIPIVVDNLYQGPHGAFSISENGTLAYLNSPVGQRAQLAWFDRAGRQLSVAGPSGEYNSVALSRDGRQVAFSRDVDRAQDVFILDLETGSLKRFTSNAAADYSPVFSPDGSMLAFASSREPAGGSGPRNTAGGQLYMRLIGTLEDDRVLLKTDAGKTISDWSRDGRFVAYTSRDDVWAAPVPPTAGNRPLRVTNTPFAESSAQFSPDGRWIAYRSNEVGSQSEVFVQSFPEPRVKHQASSGGGVAPRWSPDGKALFYVGPDATLKSVSITTTAGEAKVSAPVSVFSSRAFTNAVEREPGYDVAGDGRFLVSVPDTERKALPVTVVLNWAATLKK